MIKFAFIGLVPQQGDQVGACLGKNSVLNKLHLGSRQLNQVPIFQGQRL